MKRFLVAGLVAASLGASAQAVVVSGAVTSGTAFSIHGGAFVILATPPAEAGLNRQETFNVYAWNETSQTLAGALSVNYLADTWAPGVLAAGTRVASHGLIYDPPNSVKGVARAAVGYVTFERPVIAVITENPELVASDFLGPLTAYDSHMDRGLEDGDGQLDSIWLSADRLTLYFDMTARNPGDNMRILTTVPEPATWAMLIAGFGMVGFAARRRRLGGRHASA